ncbi:hypothetical protein [Anaeromyxobacter oryzae]|uniref:DUF3553 domain-containing protein n=1 Tax=Anaeromyxobacter oryzae TaxID=2918170 RepID=A0ABM7WTM3_9BACT|nr:hypothetical protein [Anaeromyxobacter oryzae]BDG02846.1 hypothetical protein AMOR_18420 [Anaeromyxobacter oryzae]
MTDANSTIPPSPPAPHVPIGAHVTSRHAPEWGKGTVLGKDGKLVRVLFVAHPSRKQVVVPATSLVVEHISNWPDPSRSAATASSPSSKSSKATLKKKLDPPERTREEGLQFFLKEFPGAFADPRYLKEEREYKWAAHEVFAQTLGDGSLSRLVEAGDAIELADRAKRVEAATLNLLYPVEKARFRSAFAQPDVALAYFRALRDLLEAAEPSSAFPAYAKAVEALPNPGGPSASWPMATVLPFAARPDVFLFVKPTPTKEVAKRFQLDLCYKPAPNWGTYEQVLKLVKLLRDDLDPLGCRDLIDVQSFIYRSV